MQKNMDIGGAPYVPWGTPRDIIPSHYRRKNAWKRLLAGALTAVMLAGLLPAAALAVPDIEGLCPHHQEHTEACGYLAPVEGASCGHIHEAGCYSDGILPAEGEGAAADACAHTHDETCGYAPATAGMPCGFDCPICPVQAQMDALPAADELRNMTAEEQQAVYTDLQAAYEAYNALTDEQKAEAAGAEIFDSLFEVFNGMVNTLENQNSYNINENVVTIDDSCGDSCPGHTIIGSGQTTKNTITVTGGIHNITIENVNINASDTPEACAFSIESGATVNLTLEGSSTLKSGTGNAGLQVPEGAALTIDGAEAGFLTVQGGSQGAGIGGGKANKGGDITIMDGDIDATGGEWGAAIGGGDNSDGCGSIKIEGGKLTLATKDNSRGGCLGYADDTNAKGGSVSIAGGEIKFNEKPAIKSGAIEISGSALMLQEGDTSLDTTEIEDSLIWMGNTAMVYGSFTMGGDYTVPSGGTLIIPQGQMLTISEDVTLTNEGIIENIGTITINGTLDNTSGTIQNIEGGGGITGADNITGNSVVTKEGLHYLDWDDSQKKLVNRIRSYSMTTELNGNTWGEEGKTTWYFVPEGSHRFNERPVVVGDVRLI